MDENRRTPRRSGLAPVSTPATLGAAGEVTLGLALRHDGQRWTGNAEAIEVTGHTLSELEARLLDELRRQYPPHSRVTVSMGFGAKTMPLWLRHHMAQLFDRRVTYTL